MKVSRETYDVIIVGAGHAGLEAALAASRSGARVAVLTGDPDRVGLMPCNPAVGGPGKSQLVHEIQALGGAIGGLADETSIHTRILNRSKGPAVRSLRVQVDRDAYAAAAKEKILNDKNITLLRGEATDIEEEMGKFAVLLTADGRRIRAAAAVVAAGTFLRGKIWYGLRSRPAGRQGEPPSRHLSRALIAVGHKVIRLKTGTPPRIRADTIDYGELEEVPADDPPGSFSGLPGPWAKATPTWMTRTGAKTHEIIRSQIEFSPIYAGVTNATGTRYCPSIEDKVVKFSDRESHLLFVEPDGLKTSEVYLQGFSSGLPPRVQEEMLKTLPGFKRAVVQRYAYAVEYDAFDPQDLTPGLMSKLMPGLFLAGQVNGTSGYEEAAAQGVIAGLNAARWAANKQEVSLSPEEGYIGVLIDDIVSRGVDEPYRMMTSRVALRLLLRGDNAEERLAPKAVAWGLRPKNDLVAVEEKCARVTAEIERLGQMQIDGVSALTWLRRPGATLAEAWRLIGAPEVRLSRTEAEQVELRARYAGYIERQLREKEKRRQLGEYYLPKEIDYTSVHNLSREAVEKLSRRRPKTLAEAARIPGLRESELTALLIHVKRARKA